MPGAPEPSSGPVTFLFNDIEGSTALLSRLGRATYAALLDLAEAHPRRNERSEARELLPQGIELALPCGAIRLVERGNEELAATGARPRKLLLTGLDSLTASERRVAQLAAEDMSNKDIAQQLFVTVKTVEARLWHLYCKLGIGSRRQLAAAFVNTYAERVGAPQGR